jgi:hypothetical protein
VNKINLTCSVCKKVYSRYPAYYTYLKDRSKYKCRGCKQHQYKEIVCPVCKKVFKVKRHIKQFFCSQKCSAKHSNKLRTKDYYIKMGNTTKKANCPICNKDIVVSLNASCKTMCEVCRKQKLKQNKHDLICVICNSAFKGRNKTTKTCSKVCKSILNKQTSTNNPNCGGFHSGKVYYYKNVTFDSTWEVEIAKFLDSKNIKWIRDKNLRIQYTDKNGINRRYYPDFYLPEYNLYLDPKNPYKLKLDKEKMEIVSKQINILYGDLDNLKREISSAVERHVYTVEAKGSAGSNPASPIPLK